MQNPQEREANGDYKLLNPREVRFALHGRHKLSLFVLVGVSAVRTLKLQRLGLVVLILELGRFACRKIFLAVCAS